MKRKYNTIGMFVGMGGSTQGLKNTGAFKELLAIDNDLHAEKCYKMNHTETLFVNMSISEETTGKGLVDQILLNGDDESKRLVVQHGIDFMQASPPCQGNSLAGKRDPNDDRNVHYLNTVNIMGQIRPAVAVIENVRGIISGDKYKQKFNKILRHVNELGYQYEIWDLNSLHYGVPQSRGRVFLICWRNDLVEAGIRPIMPYPDMLGAQLFRIKYVLPDVKYVHPGQFYKNKITGKRQLAKSAENYVPTMLKSAPPILYLEDGTKRKPTIEEGLMLMSFPEDYMMYSEKSGVNPKTGLEYQYKDKWDRLGNAVPPFMMQAVANSAIAMLDAWEEIKNKPNTQQCLTEKNETTDENQTDN